ncbi:MAG: capsular biosynthesis protein [Pyrinomonadaceae bacterium]|nr:capsular biosynthesis protein [Sphingobacteriaceae bacterium]
MLTFFTSKPKISGVDFSTLRTDMHSHIIPGIDDGSQNVAQSIRMIEVMMELGYQKIITTPHIKYDHYPNTRETIYTGLSILQEELTKQNINIQIEAAAEYYLDEAFERKLDDGDILTIANKYVLFELSFFNFPLNLFQIIAKIIEKGYTPILAHPERYAYLAGSMENFYKIKEAGCMLQMNIIALMGYYGKVAQRVAEELVNHNLIDFAGSDMHHIKHAEALKQASILPQVERLFTNCPLQNALL